MYRITCTNRPVQNVHEGTLQRFVAFASTRGRSGSSAVVSTGVDLPESVALIADLQQPVLGIVTFAAGRAGEVAAPGCTLAVVVFGHGKGCAAAAGDQEHLEGRLVFHHVARGFTGRLGLPPPLHDSSTA